MQTIIHISADFPDPLVPAKTRAVANLIDATPGFRHVVYSLNRVSWRKGVSRLAFAEDRVALAYGAPPYGIGLAGYLRPVAAAIRDDLIHRRVDPDVIHAHKFSVEGLVAAELSAEFRRPLIASLWGDTDIKIFEAKPILRGHYREIAASAAMLLPAAPWTADYFAKALSLGPDRFETLPVITAADAILPPRAIGRPQLVTVLSLDSWRRKGLDTLMRAAVLLKPEFPDLLIDVYGSGSPGSLMEVTRMIERTGADRQMRLLGPTAHGAVQRTINSYAAFVMPTRRETYGMVHIEAVLAGVPILWSRERGIDGLMEDGQVGYRCDPASVEDVAAGIAFLLNREVELKRRISRLQSTGAFEALRRAAIAARYRDLLEQTLGNTARTAAFPNLQKVESL